MASLAKYPALTPSVEIPYLTTQDLTIEGDGTFLRFYGHGDPVGVRSRHNPTRTWTCEASFPTAKYADAEALIVLLRDALNHPTDRRLMLTPGIAEGTQQSWALNTPAVVEVHAVSVGRAAGMVTVSFTATRVRAN